MSKTIIISGKERVLKPWIALIMSFFITGMGEIYSGCIQKGIILALLRASSALVVPFYSITNIRNSYLTEISLSIMFFFIISIFSPLAAFFSGYKKNKIVITRLNSTGALTLFALCSFMISIFVFSVFFSFFSIIRLNSSYPPVIEKGDIVIVKKIGNRLYKKGEMIMLNDENSGFARIIGQPGEKVNYTKGRFSVQGSELILSIFTENELKKFPLTDLDVISETEGSFKYPVIQNRDQHNLDIVLKNDEYFAAPDDRRKVSGFVTIKNENISGRVEGLLFSPKRIKLLIKPYQIYQ